MDNVNIPTDRELPSTRKLVKTTALAAGVAALLLVAVVMPAEYGIDPTGLGRVTGLRAMGKVKVAHAREAEEERLAEEQFEIAMQQRPASAEQQQVAVQALFGAAAPSAAPPAVAAVAAPAEGQGATSPASSAARRHDETTVVLQPNEAKEVKLELKKGDVVEYVWSSNAGKVSFDTLADSKALSIEYHSYARGSSAREQGTLHAAFDGAHGWFWRNRSGAALTITLQTNGPYTAIEREL